MSVNPELSSIRAKKIGVLLFDGRQAADKEVIRLRPRPGNFNQRDIAPMKPGVSRPP